MHAPLRFFRSLITRRALVAAVLVIAAALVAAGCAPQDSRLLLRLPDDLPRSIQYLPGDSMGWLLFDTDTESTRWDALATATGGHPGRDLLTAWGHQLLGPDADASTEVRPWIGSQAGVTLVTSDISSDDALLGFAEVRKRGALEAALRRAHFTRHPDADLGDGIADDLMLWTPPHASHLPAVGVADDALVLAPTRAALRELLARTHEYRAVVRPAMVRNTRNAMQHVPVSFIYRGDDVRDQLLRLVRADPSALELGRWMMSTSVVSASRDGWIGLAPPVDRSRHALRVVGRFDWVKGQSVIGEPKPVKRQMLDGAPAATTLGVAMTDPGALATDIVGSATHNGSQFATKQDVPKADPQVQLFRLLDQLDGAASITREPGDNFRVRVSVRSVPKALRQAQAALDLVGQPDRWLITVEQVGQTTMELWVRPAPVAGRRPAALPLAPAAHTLATSTRYVAAFRAVGTPPRRPIAWVYASKSCDATQGIAGWLTWDRDKYMTYAVDVPLGAGGLAACADAAPVHLPGLR